MVGRQSVKVTYAHKRRRVRNVAKKLFSSPLEVLPPDVDDLTRTQMARRMLKRSRRVALAEQLEDKNVEHIREHLAKRIKRTQEGVSNPEPNEGPLDVSPRIVLSFQTPFPSPQSAHKSAVPLVPEQLSPVPVARRVISRTSSRNLKENSTHPQILASPFSSRPGSAASSPKHSGRGRSSCRVSRVSLHAKSRTLSGVIKENARRVLRKDSTVSLKDTDREPFARRIQHRRFPSSPSTAYMRSQSAQGDWIAAPKAFSRAFDDYDENMSPGEFAYSNTSFYADQPQSCSTPAISRARTLPDLRGRHAEADSFLTSLSLRQDSTETGPDIEMDGLVPTRRQTIHLSGNSIFSSSDEFTVRSLLATHNDGTGVESSCASDLGEAPARVDCQILAHHEADQSQPGHSLAGSFIAEYNIPLPDLDHSFASTAATKMIGPEGVPKLSVGEQQFGFPGTSPARGENHVIRSSRSRNSVAKSSVAEQPFGLPGTSPARGESLVIVRASRNASTLASPPHTIASCPPSSPASDLALGLQSMDIRGDTHSDGETHCPPTSFPLQARSYSLRDGLAEPTMRKSVKRRPARNRAGTIRASDFVKPGAPSGVTAGSTAPPLSNVRRTRSGTVVGPDSKLVAKGTGSSQTAKGSSTIRLAPVQSGFESESDDELLLKGFWTEDVEYLGRPVPPGRMDAEPDELNLGGSWHSLESGPLRVLGLRR